MSIELFFGDIVKDEGTGTIGVVLIDHEHNCPGIFPVPTGTTGITISGKIKLGSILTSSERERKACLFGYEQGYMDGRQEDPSDGESAYRDYLNERDASEPISEQKDL